MVWRLPFLYALAIATFLSLLSCASIAESSAPDVEGCWAIKEDSVNGERFLLLAKDPPRKAYKFVCIVDKVDQVKVSGVHQKKPRYKKMDEDLSFAFVSNDDAIECDASNFENYFEFYPAGSSCDGKEIYGVYSAAIDFIEYKDNWVSKMPAGADRNYSFKPNDISLLICKGGGRFTISFENSKETFVGVRLDIVNDNGLYAIDNVGFSVQ